MHQKATTTTKRVLHDGSIEISAVISAVVDGPGSIDGLWSTSTDHDKAAHLFVYGLRVVAAVGFNTAQCHCRVVNNNAQLTVRLMDF